MAGSRFTPEAAQAMREAIRDAGGVEVFAIGDVELGTVTGVTISCRGTEDSVPALLDRPRAGQVVIHNHPSGDLRPSTPDLQLAHLWGEDGVGVVIVDNAVERSNFVVEPFDPKPRPVDDDALEAFFTRSLPTALPGWEARPQQLEMARHVARCLEQDRPLLCEAGTGTGKSLAYLVPAALWALANDSKVVVSTFTRALQSQLLASDLPLLPKGGLPVKTAVLQGRNNYLCKRRLRLALDEEPEGEELAALQALQEWSGTTRDGSRSDLGFAVDPALWERVLSDADLTLSVRCEHYGSCHYYTARREASAAHVVVVNHALLLTDLSLRAEHGRGFLPKYQRLILDEAHHLEDAATGVSTSKVSARGVSRAIAPLLDSRRRRGALSRLVAAHGGESGALRPEQRQALVVHAATAEGALSGLRAGTTASLSTVAHALLPGDEPQRITTELLGKDPWDLDAAPTVRHLAAELAQAAESLDAIEGLFQDATLAEAQALPLMDLRRGRRRLQDHAATAEAFLQDAFERCRWVEPDRERRGERTAALCGAPIEVAPVLNRILWGQIPGTAATSATLTVAGRFDHWIQRTGLELPVVEQVVYPSPFDHESQALLGLPRDLPSPDDPRFLPESAKVVVEAVRASDGGAFVLCTSYAAVRAYAEAVRQGAGDRPVLAQGDAGRGILLERFRENRRAVLVGTDSFWEGVSVRGEGLRLVVIPRIPFRVPTEPLQQARHERIAKRGGDPFRSYSLPEAVLKLRQGYGRLIRSHTDRGAVLLLDRRIHEKSYGRIVLHSLPPARRVTGPWIRVRQSLTELYAALADGR